MFMSTGVAHNLLTIYLLSAKLKVVCESVFKKKKDGKNGPENNSEELHDD